MTFEYKYKNLRGSKRQYAGINLAKEKIVKAEYVDTYVYRGNPFIEALPLAKTEEEVNKSFTYVPALPAIKEFYKMPVQLQEIMLNEIKKFRVALPFHSDAVKEFSSTLIESYASRVPDKKPAELSVNGIPYLVKHGLRAFHPGEATNGFAMLGVAGSGKSTAMNMILDDYPQVIIHEFPDETIVQIVYLYVVCEPNSNFNALYEKIGRAIDEALGNGNHSYEQMIHNIVKGGLGKKSSKVQELIDKFSIGIIILDEIQNIDLKSNRENSLEALLTINNSTHVGFGVLGTEEAFNDLFSKERTIRRFSSFIPASRYTNDRKAFERIVFSLFLLNVFRKPVIPDAEIIEAFYDETDGVIAHAVSLYYYILEDYIHKNKHQIITPEYIQSIAKTKRKIIHETVYRHKNSTELKNLERKKTVQKMHSYTADESEVNTDDLFVDALKPVESKIKSNDAVEKGVVSEDEIIEQVKTVKTKAEQKKTSAEKHPFGEPPLIQVDKAKVYKEVFGEELR